MEEREVRRMSALFTDILDFLVQYCCLFLRGMNKIGLKESQINFAVQIYELLLADLSVKDTHFVQCFTLKERLRILHELNSLFQLVPHIIEDVSYWKTIRDGLYDSDNYCRKVSVSVLKSNLKVLGDENLYSDKISKQEFELLWTTFFDIYDTLESFGSHLTKVRSLDY